MIKFQKILLSMLIVLVQTAFPQYLPKTFKTTMVNDQSEATISPTSNSFSDCVNVHDTIWVASSRGLHKTPDRGKSWFNYTFNGASITALNYDKATGRIWVALATTKNDVETGLGLAYTSNSGITWNSIEQPVDKDDDTIVMYGNNKLFAVPVTVPQKNLTYDIAFSRNTVWITSFAGGTRKSIDGGKTWTRVVLPPDYLNSIKPTDTLSFALSPIAGNLTKEGYYNYRAFSVTSDADSLIFVGTAAGINMSTDNGKSWKKFNAQNQIKHISGDFVVAIEYDKNNNVIWASTRENSEVNPNQYQALSYSTDLGNTWAAVLENTRTNSINTFNNQTIVSTDNGIYRSSNFGSVWSKLGRVVDPVTKLEILDSRFYGAGVIQKSDSTDIFLCNNDGLVKITEKNSSQFWDGQWKIYFSSEKLKSKSSTYCYPNPFSPKIDGNVKIKYSTNGQRKKVTIRILNFDMNLVRTLVENVERGSSIHSINPTEVIDLWDGKTDSGAEVANGVYFYRIDIDGEEPIFNKIIVVK